MNSPTRFLANGDTVLVVEFGENIDLSTSRKVTALHVTVSALELDGITDLVPTFRSLAVHYDPDRVTFADSKTGSAVYCPITQAGMSPHVTGLFRPVMTSNSHPTFRPLRKPAHCRSRKSSAATAVTLTMSTWSDFCRGIPIWVISRRESPCPAKSRPVFGFPPDLSLSPSG